MFSVLWFRVISSDVLQVVNADQLTRLETLGALPSSSTQRKATGTWLATILQYSSSETPYWLVGSVVGRVGDFNCNLNWTICSLSNKIYKEISYKVMNYV